MLKVLNVKVFACMRMKTNSFKIKYPQIKYNLYLHQNYVVHNKYKYT